MKMDKEVKAMHEAINYMEESDKRSKERFIHHLVHRYFPDGRFNPKEQTIDIEMLRP